jgi:tetratricopeptide (TPR) repeat protein
MGVAGLVDGLLAYVTSFTASPVPMSLAAAVAGVATTALLFVGISLRRRKLGRARAARLEWRIHDLKEQLRARLAEPREPFAVSSAAAPTLGACAAFEADIETAARTVLKEAGGHRARAKHLLRKKLGVNGLNGTEAAYWRQLGALCLLDSTRDAIRAYARAADLAPDDPQAQMLAGVLYLRDGRVDAAESAFRRQLELAGTSDDGAAARCRAGTMLGDALAAKGDHEAALAAYDAARSEAEALVASNPTDAGRQRELSLTHDRIGDLHLAGERIEPALESYQRSLAIAKTLAARERSNLGYQRDLSVSHERIGEVLERKGDLDGALVSYREGLGLAKAIARRDRDRPEWQWDVSVSLDRIGDVLLAKGKVGEALASYHRGLEVAESAVERVPSRTTWQRDLAATYHKVGSLEATSGNDAEAAELLERGRAIIAHLDRIATHREQWRSDLRKFDQALQTLRT